VAAATYSIRSEDDEKRFIDDWYSIGVDVRRPSQGQAGTDKRRRSRQLKTELRAGIGFDDKREEAFAQSG
jgi:hypothetical protein